MRKKKTGWSNAGFGRIFPKTLLLGSLLCMTNVLAAKYWIPTGYEVYAESPMAKVLLDTVPENFLKSYFDKSASQSHDVANPVIKESVEYNPEEGRYNFVQKIGQDYFSVPRSMTFQEYIDYRAEEQRKDYYDALSGNSLGRTTFGEIDEPIERKKPSINLIETLFGSDKIEFNPRGNVGITLGYTHRKNENPTFSQNLRNNGNLDFDMNINFNLEGRIGDKLNLGFNWNNKSTFDFDRNIKIAYQGTSPNNFDDDGIIKGVEAGNVALPLQNTLIQGSQNLFGIKLTSQFGRLTLTTLIAQQNSTARNTDVRGGAIEYDFEIAADQYDENRHFFLSHYFKEVFDTSMIALPQLLSQIRITQIEVWVTDNGRSFRNVRRVLGVADLGEGDPENFMNTSGEIRPQIIAQDRGFLLADNGANDLYASFLRNQAQVRNFSMAPRIMELDYGMSTSDFELDQVRLLQPTEYTVNRDLGFVSLRRRLEPNQSLSVAFEYEYRGQKYQVGEISTNSPRAASDSVNYVLITKLLRDKVANVGRPMWDLMMKNFYHLQAYGLEQQDFQLDVVYQLPGTLDSRYIPRELSPNGVQIPLLSLFRLDRTNRTGDPQPDGEFDFVNSITMDARTGIMMFPQREPFGSFLAQNGYPQEVVFQELYDSTIRIAESFPEKNRFLIKGQYKTANGNIIPLDGFNIPRGSVSISAGGQRLVEGSDYRIDYGAGYVEILNPSYLGPGSNIQVNYEDQSAFGNNRKTMLGLRADYEVSKDFNLGVTMLNLYERPFTQKVDVNNDPINNWIYGLDMTLSKEAPFLTRMLQSIPLLRTKGESRIDVRAETAILRPGHSRAINNGGEGLVMLDDFEGSSFGTDIRTAVYNWKLSSVPNNPKFTEYRERNTPGSRLALVNRASMSWYNLEQVFFNNLDPDHPLLVNPYTRPVPITDVFQNRDLDQSQRNFLRTLDIHYDPTKRGPYNFDEPGGTAHSAGMVVEGQDQVRLLDPASRWAGMTTHLNVQDFEDANFESIEFWILDPFLDPGDPSFQRTRSSGELYINLGTISEDVLPDGEYSFESGLPTPNNGLRTRPSPPWGVVPTADINLNAWDPDPATRELQDVGYDGLGDEREAEVFGDWLAKLPAADRALISDPANDNYFPFRSPSFEPTTYPQVRYERYNYPQGNSQLSDGEEIFAATNQPDDEDLDRDNIVNTTDDYFEYRVPLNNAGSGLDSSNKYIVDAVTNVRNGVRERWYLFRIPLNDSARTKVGNIQDLRSMRFVRLYATGFQEPVTLRFASLELIRNSWRQYAQEIRKTRIGSQGSETGSMTVTNVGVEDNSNKQPFNYVLPPNLQRELAFQAVGATQQNEQSLLMDFRQVPAGVGKGVFKSVGRIDMRDFERIRLFSHLEETLSGSAFQDLEDNEVSLFIRIGEDFENHYYEIEKPLKVSDRDSALAIMRAATDAYRELVWPSQNTIDVRFEDLVSLKEEREKDGGRQDVIYPAVGGEELNGETILKVLGNPSLGSPKSIMIGFYNNTGESTGTLNKVLSGEIWVNELGLLGLNERGGVAAVASVDMQLADFGRVTVSGDYKSIGFGGLADKVFERTRDQTVGYDVNAAFELGKFFEEDWGVRLPFYYQHEKKIVTPRYDAVYEDIELDDAFEIGDAETSNVTRAEVKDRSAETYTRNTVGVTNMTVNPRTDKVPKPWSPRNVRLSYEQTKIVEQTPQIKEIVTTERRAGLNYDYAIPALYVQPLKSILPDNKFLMLLSEFNFNPVPNNISFNTQMTRLRNTREFRNVPESAQSVWVNKRFTWDRNYNLSWDLTRSLKIRFDAANEAVIDELNENPADFDPNFVYDSEENDRLVREGLRNFGRTQNYRHNINVNYELPFRHIPYLDFIKVTATGRADYAWNAAPRFLDGSTLFDPGLVDVGNTIQNSQERRLALNMDFRKLYSNIGFLDKLDQYRTQPKKGKAPSGEKAKASDQISSITHALLRPFLTLRSFDVNYTETFRSVTPGYQGETQLFGATKDWKNPGWKQLLGFQPDANFYLDLYSEDLLSRSDNVNQIISRQEEERLDSRLNLEPFRDLKIELTANKSLRRTFEENFNTGFDPSTGRITYDPWSATEIGSMEVSYIGISTMFGTDPNDLFDQFERNRGIIRDRLNDAFDVPEQFTASDTVGFGRTNKDVVIPAFIAAYSGGNARNIDLDVFGVDFPVSAAGLFSYIPRPNWRLNFTGLQNIPALKEVFRSITLSHSYEGRMVVNSFALDRDFVSYDSAAIGDNVNPASNSFYSFYEVPEVSIRESLNPLIDLNFVTTNDMRFAVGYSKIRDLRLSYGTEGRMTENLTDQLNIGVGYIFKNVFLGFLHGGDKRALRKRQKQSERKEDPAAVSNPRNRTQATGSELTLSLDINFSDNLVLIHNLDDQGLALVQNQSTRRIQITPNAQYRISQDLTLRAFFDYSKSEPYTLSSAPLTTINSGFELRYTIR